MLKRLYSTGRQRRSANHESGGLIHFIHEPRRQKTKSQAKFYHAGCPVCVEAEQSVAAALDPNRFEVEIVHLGDSSNRLAEAESAGVKSVPALVIDGHAFHINHGADLSALK